MVLSPISEEEAKEFADKNKPFDIYRPWLTLDPWQKEYIKTEGNCFLLCGRQVGKTTAASIKFGERAVRKKSSILMIALTEKQAYQLFFKTLMYLETKYPKLIRKGKDRPTQHIIRLRNGSVIMCYAAGKTGDTLRTFTITDLVIDEAAPMAKEIFIAVTPMLSVTGGSMDLLSTPRGKAGFFYECSKRDDFTKFYVSAEDCPRHNKDFLEAEKTRMSKLQYAQEYMAKFLDELKRVFSEELLKKIKRVKRPENIDHACKHYLGVDIARLGEDESTFEIIKRIDQDHFHHVENIVTKKTLTTETEKKILELESAYNFSEIDIDAGAGSLGVGVFDHLLEEDATKRKVVAINNRSRPFDKDESSKGKLLKEDLYTNMVTMLERGQLSLLDDDEVFASLASMQYEYILNAGQKTRLKIFGSYSHIAEGLVRAAWAASKDKRLNIWVR